MAELPEHERRRNARELEQLMAELDEIDRVHGLGTHPAVLERGGGRDRGRGGGRRSRRRDRGRGRRDAGTRGRTPRHGRGERSRTALVTFVVAVALFGFVVADSVDVGVTYARFQAWLTGEPTPPTEGRGYEFAQTQPGSDQPVGWDPCVPVRVLVNPAGAPAGGVDMVRTALERTSAATGLRMEVVGTTDSRAFFDPRRSLDEPVLVGWAGPREVEGLAGRVAGLGGGVSRGVEGGRQYLEQGSIVLDGPLFRSLSRSADGLRGAQAVVDHEAGHLVGLSHVEDPSQLMNAESGATDYGAGDLAGLSALGEVPCR